MQGIEHSGMSNTGDFGTEKSTDYFPSTWQLLQIAQKSIYAHHNCKIAIVITPAIGPSYLMS